MKNFNCALLLSVLSLYATAALAATNADANYEYGMVVCDVNDLKYVNDKFGHDYGDEYLCKACQIICGIYKRSPVFRTGGDEFVVLLEGEDYKAREELFAQIAEISGKNALTENGIVIAAGMAIKQGNEDFHEVFRRADEKMYAFKSELKGKRPSHVVR